MSNEEIISEINVILIDEFEIEEGNINPNANILEVLKIDSLDLVDLVVLIERKFGFKVQSEDFADIKVLQDFYTYVISKVTPKNNISEIN